MKRLRGAKAASVGTKDEKKKVMGALDSDIHKLLGTEYKRYRTVQVGERPHTAPCALAVMIRAVPRGASLSHVVCARVVGSTPSMSCTRP